ncbi:VOC family protein [Sneathiella chungangensis]|uniref:VOC family protein n=1 Tax=Sneathiella chungangensis TaxID=1418234 RepID=A0A845MRQ1_9PROT|nr:VOC family protein [Sneathiella chungangensis]MZR24274.1 VOC family protein [Sneathiella chungangensis]
MDQRLSLITLGVRDLARSTAFFEKLGWKRSVKDAPGVSFFQCGSIAFGLFPRDELANDAGVSPEGSGFEGFSIAYNARSKEEVDEVLTAVQALGADIVKPAADVFWGGYSGYFRDLDGHLWEVAWNPGFEIDATGAVNLPD